MRCDQYGRRFGHILRKKVKPMPIILTLHVFGLTVHIVGLLAVIRRKRPAYRRCTPEATAENILNREFTANAVNKKWCTDVTEMKYGARGEKAYLSAILDLKSRDIVSFAIGRHNNNQLVFETYEELVHAVGQFIHYYNHQRRQHRLNCLAPMDYRSLLEAA